MAEPGINMSEEDFARMQSELFKQKGYNHPIFESLQNVRGGTYGDRTLGMTQKIHESAQGMIDMYGGTDFMDNPDFIRDFNIFKKAYPGQEQKLMSILGDKSASNIAPIITPGNVPQGPWEKFMERPPVENIQLTPKGLTEVTPTNPIDLTPNLTKQNIPEVPTEGPGLFGIKNLFKGQSKLSGMIQRSQNATSKLDPTAKIGASMALSAIRPQDWLGDDDATTVSAGDIAGKGLQFIKGIGSIATGIDVAGGISDIIQAPLGIYKDFIQRKVARGELTDEAVANLHQQRQDALAQRSKQIASQDESARLRSEEKWGFNVNNPFAQQTETFADKGARVSDKYLSQDYKDFLKNNLSRGGFIGKKRPENIKHAYNFKKGGRAFGPSHEKGGIPGFTKSGNMVEFEGNEMIFSREDSGKIQKLKDSGNFMQLGKFVSGAIDKWPGGYK